MQGARGFEAHKDKTGYIVYGCREFKEKVERELESTPLRFGECDVRRKESDKYAYLPTCLLAYLPTCLLAYLPTCLLAYLPT